MDSFDIDIYITKLLTTPNINLDIGQYLGRYPNLFPQLNLWGAPNQTTYSNLQNQNRIDVRWLEEHTITRRIEPWKSTTVWYIATVMLDGATPIALLKNTDNKEDMYNDLFLLNKKQHHYASAYLYSFVEADPGPHLEPYDTIGTFSGDVMPHVSGRNTKYYNLSAVKDVEYLNKVFSYTEKYNF